MSTRQQDTITTTRTVIPTHHKDSHLGKPSVVAESYEAILDLALPPKGPSVNWGIGFPWPPVPPVSLLLPVFDLPHPKRASFS